MKTWIRRSLVAVAALAALAAGAVGTGTLLATQKMNRQVAVTAVPLALKSDAQTFIIATDNGLMHRIRQLAPGKTLLEAPTAGRSATCKSCAHCPWMAMNALQGVVQALEQGSGEIFVDEPVRAQALGCIERMLDFTAKHPAATAQPAFVKNIGAA